MLHHGTVRGKGQLSIQLGKGIKHVACNKEHQAIVFTAWRSLRGAVRHSQAQDIGKHFVAECPERQKTRCGLEVVPRVRRVGQAKAAVTLG